MYTTMCFVLLEIISPIFKGNRPSYICKSSVSHFCSFAMRDHLRTINKDGSPGDSWFMKFINDPSIIFAVAHVTSEMPKSVHDSPTPANVHLQ